MKKKILNVLLSAAVITTMMFTITACGSKDDADNTAAVTPVEDNVAEQNTAETNNVPESTMIESTAAESTETAAASTGVTLEDWVASDEAKASLDYMNGSLSGMHISFEAEGDVFSVIYSLDEVQDIADGAEEQMKSIFESQKSAFDPLRSMLAETTGNENITIHVVFLNGDGTEIYSEDC